MRTHDHACRRRSSAAAAVCACALLLAAACAREDRCDDLKLPESRYGFYLGETKNEVFKRAKGIATITKAPPPPVGYRGELYDFSRPLEARPEVARVRLAFFENRLFEVIVYFRDTSYMSLDRLRRLLEGELETTAVAEDGKFEMAQKTLRLKGPGIAVTLRRITKKESTELYVQYLHDELHRRFIEKNKEVGPR